MDLSPLKLGKLQNSMDFGSKPTMMSTARHGSAIQFEEGGSGGFFTSRNS
jgi:hypothetical protein